MASIIVPQSEINRIIELILEQYNEQFKVLQTALTVNDVSSIFVIPREDYKNAIEVRTNDLTDALVFRVNINYTLSDKPVVMPFRLEVLENMENGDGSKIYIGMAKLPRSIFPSASKYVFDPIHAVGMVTFSRPGYPTSIVTVQRIYGSLGEASVDIYHEDDLLGTVTFADGEFGNKTFDTELGSEAIVRLTNTDPAGILGSIIQTTVLKPVPVPVVSWTSALQDFVVANEGDEYNPSMQRSFNSGELEIDVTVTIDNDPPYDTTATFALGSLTTNLDLNSESLPHAYEVTIQPGVGYTVGLVNTVQGTVTEESVPSPGVLGFVSPTGFCGSVDLSRVGGTSGSVSVGVYESVNSAPGDLIQTVTWTDGDSADKTISVCSVSQHDAMALILSNPVNATVDPTKQTKTILANGVIEFVSDEMACGEVGVSRIGPAIGSASATVYREDSEVEGTVTWANMETGIKYLDACPYIEGNDGTATMTLGGITGAPAGGRLSATVVSGHYQVLITVYPLDAEVVVMDSNEDTVEPESPGTYSLLPGVYTLHASADGYQTLIQEFTVSNSDLVIEESLEEELVFTPVPMDFVPSSFTPISTNSTWEKINNSAVRFTKTYVGSISDLGSTVLAFNFDSVPELSDFYVEFTIANYGFNKTGGDAVSPPPFVADISFYQQLSGTPTANIINTYSEAGGMFSVASNMLPEVIQAASSATATPRHVGLYVSGGYYKVWHKDAGWVSGENTYTSDMGDAWWFGDGHIPAYFFMGIRTDSTTDNQGTASLDVVIINGSDIAFANNDPLLIGTGVERLVLGSVEPQVGEICNVILLDTFDGTGDLVGHEPDIGNTWIEDLFNPYPSPTLVDQEIAASKVAFGDIPQSEEDLDGNNTRVAGLWLIENSSERQITNIVCKLTVIVPGIPFISESGGSAFCSYSCSFHKAQDNLDEYYGGLELYTYRNLTTGEIRINGIMYDQISEELFIEGIYPHPLAQERTFDIELRIDPTKVVLLNGVNEIGQISGVVPLPSRVVAYSQFMGSFGMRASNLEVMFCTDTEQPGMVGFGLSPQYPNAVNAARQAGASGPVSVDIVFEDNVIHTLTWSDGEQGRKEIDLSGDVNPGDTIYLQNSTGGLVISSTANEVTLESEDDGDEDPLRFDRYGIDAFVPAQDMVFSNGDKDVLITGAGNTGFIMHTVPNKFTGDCYQELSITKLPPLPVSQDDVISTGVELGEIIVSITNAHGDGSYYAVLLQYYDEIDTQVVYQIGSINPDTDLPATILVYTDPATLTRKIGINGEWFDHAYSELNEYQYATKIPFSISSQVEFSTSIFVSEEGAGITPGLEYEWKVTGSADEISYTSPGTVFDDQDAPNGPGQITFIADQFNGTWVGVARVLGNEGAISAEVTCEGSAEVNTDASWDDGLSENVIAFSVEDNFGDRTGNILTLENPTGGASIGVFPETEWFQNYPTITFVSDEDYTSFGNPANPKTIALEVRREGGLKLHSRVKWRILSVSSPAILAQFDVTEGEIVFYLDEDSTMISFTKIAGDNLNGEPTGWNGGNVVVELYDPTNANLGAFTTQTHTCGFLF